MRRWWEMRLRELWKIWIRKKRWGIKEKRL